MKVLKFGGTSVGSVKSILQIKGIVGKAEQPVIVVVSAMGGITDQLLHTAQKAAGGDVDYEVLYNNMYQRHLQRRPLHQNWFQSSSWVLSLSGIRED